MWTSWAARITPYDDNGHGTHVAGIIAGNGYDSNGSKAGVAPDANLVSLKVLDASGKGNISNVIAALDWVLANRAAYNIRVVNLSVGAAIHESYRTDPLTLAAKRVVDAGVVVVSAAGNFGKNAAGLAQYGGINAPGNAPWVLTVGASTTNGTVRRADDASRRLQLARSDLSRLVRKARPRCAWRRHGVACRSDQRILFDQIAVSGAGRDADGLSAVSEPERHEHGGAGRVRHRRADAAGESGADAERGEGDPAVHRAGVRRKQRADAGCRLPQLARRRAPRPLLRDGPAWPALSRPDHVEQAHHLGQPLVDRRRHAADRERMERSAPPGASPRPTNGDNIVWGTAGRRRQHRLGHVDDGDNIVWGTSSDGDNIVWGTSGDGDNIVWGTSTDGDNIVWGTDCGGADCGDNIVWGTAATMATTSCGARPATATTSSGAPTVTATTSSGAPGDGDNIVWGTSTDGDNIVWGTDRRRQHRLGHLDDGDNIVWGTGSTAGVLVGDFALKALRSSSVM